MPLGGLLDYRAGGRSAALELERLRQEREQRRIQALGTGVQTITGGITELARQQEARRRYEQGRIDQLRQQKAENERASRAIGVQEGHLAETRRHNVESEGLAESKAGLETDRFKAEREDKAAADRAEAQRAEAAKIQASIKDATSRARGHIAVVRKAGGNPADPAQVEAFIAKHPKVNPNHLREIYAIGLQEEANDRAAADQASKLLAAKIQSEKSQAGLNYAKVGSEKSGASLDDAKAFRILNPLPTEVKQKEIPGPLRDTLLDLNDQRTAARRVLKMAKAMGSGPMQQIAEYVNKKAGGLSAADARYVAAYKFAVEKYARKQSGAAISAQEWSNFQAQVGDIWQNPEAFQAGLSQYLQNVEDQFQARMSFAASMNYKLPDFGPDPTTAPSKEGPDVKQVKTLAEELQKQAAEFGVGLDDESAIEEVLRRLETESSDAQ